MDKDLARLIHQIVYMLSSVLQIQTALLSTIP